MELLKINNLSKEYSDGTKALKNIDLMIDEGEFIIIIGPSGSGKSTFLRTINRLVEPTAGSIVFMGEHVEKAKSKELRKIRAKIGMIFQHYNLVPQLSVLENVLHGRLGYMSSISGLFNRYSESDKEDAIRFLRGLGLENEIYKRADELSGGQKQRVGVCRALAQHPKLILADEPIASLDPKSSIDVMDAIYKGSKTFGISCIVNLHQVEIAKRYATRIIGIRKGEVLYDGSPANLTDEIIEGLYHGVQEEKQMVQI